MAATSVSSDDIEVRGTSLRWYDATETVQYGFCGVCGSTMFWRAADKPQTIAIAAGTLDPPTGLVTVAALFVDDASDYHELDPSLIHYAQDH